MKENKQKKIKLKKKKILLKYKKKKETLKEEEKKPTVHQSKKKSLKLRLMSSRKCPHENAIEVCMLCEDIFAYKSSFEIYFRIKDTRTYIRRPTTLYIVKSLHHGPYVSFKSCLLLAYFTIWHMAWKTKCVQTLFTLEDRLPKNPWIHLILNWKKSKLQLPAKKNKSGKKKEKK